MIIYKGKYGATRQYAIWLGTALELPIAEAGCETVDQLADADYVIMGSSVYMGKLQLKRWIKENLLFLATKKLYLFVVSGTPLDDVNRLTEYVKDNVPEELRSKIECFFFPGKLEFSQLSFKDKVLLKMRAWLHGSSRRNKMQLTDYNKVNRLNITQLVNAAAYQQVA